MPNAAAVGLAIVGFCCVEVKPFGPVHENAAPEAEIAERLIGDPVQMGLFDDATGGDGFAFTVVFVVPAATTALFWETETE